MYIKTKPSLGKANEILMISVHVRELYIDELEDLCLGYLLLLPHSGTNDSLRFFTQSRIARHLREKQTSECYIENNDRENKNL